MPQRAPREKTTKQPIPKVRYVLLDEKGQAVIAAPTRELCISAYTRNKGGRLILKDEDYEIEFQRMLKDKWSMHRAKGELTITHPAIKEYKFDAR